ncbi:MAG: Flp family type IVb pilin [Bacteriovoracaceae bacterium]
MNKKSRFWANQEGQGVMEYILLSSLIGIFCLLALRNYGQGLRKQINYFKKEINSLPRR